MNFSKLVLAFSGIVLLLSSCAKPLANFVETANSTHAPAKYSFKNTSQNANTYSWDFGDGTKSTEISPTHQYSQPGEYTVKLTAMKKNKSNTKDIKLNIDAPSKCLVEIQTDFGNMIVELFDSTPQHRDNFLKLAEEHYFDDLLFHRVIEGFMIQGGDPNSKGAKAGVPLGSGGPSYTIPAEFVDTLAHIKGALAAARTGDNVNPQKRSSGSQFYIVQGTPQTKESLSNIESKKGFHYSPDVIAEYLKVGGTPFLDRDYTVFGRVIQGLDVIDKIAAVQKGPGDRPASDVKMKIRVIK
ncbi:MAG: peptidylprolyl isomerase [Saprospiraceae bacterium]|nr:peptidylprolyl isomerase [Saprospiraceae bacterium]